MTAQVWLQLGYAAALIGATFLVHTMMIIFGRHLLIRKRDGIVIVHLVWDTLRLVLLAVWLFIAHCMAVWLWAWLYSAVGINATLEEALYFAITCYTTLGFGDIVPPLDWRLLAGAASANGLLLFGLSGAVLVDATVRIRTGR